MSSPEAEIRAFREGDEGSINDGFNEVFGQMRRLDDWRWKYQAEPEGRFISVAVDPGGRVLVHHAAVGVRLALDGVVLLGGQGADAFCLPQARGSRLYSATVMHFFDHHCGPGGLGFFYGFAGDRNASILLKHHDYTLLGQVPLWTRPPGLAWPRWGHTVREGLRAGSLDGLWRRCADRYRWAVVRDSRWYGRRFEGRPGVSYVHLHAWRRGTLHGWLVARVDGGVLRVADLLWDGEDPGALAALDAASQRLGRAAGCRRAEMWLLGDPEAAVAMLECGWRPTAPEAPIYVVARSFNPAVALSSVQTSLYVTMTDADMV